MATPPLASTSSAVPFKRPVFARPVFAKPVAAVVTQDEDFFSRSTHIHPSITAEYEARLRKKIAKKEQTQVPAKAPEARGNDKHKSKRRRVSQEGSDESQGSLRKTPDRGAGRALSVSEDDSDRNIPKRSSTRQETKQATPVKGSRRPSDSERQSSSPKPLTKRYKQSIDASTERKTTRSSQSKSTIIDLEDSNDDEPEIVATTAAVPVSEDPESEVDEEFAEIARRAREKARRKRLQTDLLHDQSEVGSSSAPGLRQPPDQFPKTHAPPIARSPQPLEPPEPVVALLITSDIPNTKPLIVNRKLGQPMKHVRSAWCDKQGFAPDFADSVMLTWKGRQLFSNTSCKTLGIGVDDQGAILLNGARDVLGDDDSRKIHLVAMTEEIFKELKNPKPAPISQPVRAEGAAEEQVPETQVRVILKAKGMEDFKLLVKPSTAIVRILRAFRAAQHVEEGKDVSLYFDGEELEPETLIGDAEVEDMDFIDVYVK